MDAQLVSSPVDTGGGTTANAKPAEGWIRRVSHYLKPHWKSAAGAFVASAIGMTATAFTPLVLRQAVDVGIVAAAKPLAPFIWLLLGLAVIRFATAFVRRLLGGRFSLDLEYDMRNEIYDHLQRLDFARHDELETGQVVSRANTDLRTLQFLFAWLPLVSGTVLSFFVSLWLMLSISVELTIVALISLPFIAWLTTGLRKWIFPASYDNQEKLAAVAQIVDEATAGVQVVKGFGQEKRELRKLADAAEEVYASRLRAVKLQAKYTAAIQTIPALGTVAVLAFAGWKISQGQMSIGTLLAFSTWLLLLLAPIRMLVMLVALAQRARAGAERVFELLDSTPEVLESPDAEPLPGAAGEIEFDDVSFGYLKSEPVVANLTLTIEPGETVAFVGASGSGKSTVAVLVPRFYDVQSGSLRIDGCDIRDVTLDSLRSQIGVVFEDTFLFSRTIGENIAFGVPDASQPAIESAARAAGIHEFIASAPDGYDTVVGEKGLTLSGGQRQRVAIARAILLDPRILILDDATSSVDVSMEEEIHRALRQVLEGRTTLIVAHRKSTIALADRVVLLDGGKIGDSGSHDELMERCEQYQRLVGDATSEEVFDSAGAHRGGLSAAALLGGPGQTGEAGDSSGGRVTAAAWGSGSGERPTATRTTAGPPPDRPRMGGGRGLMGGGGGGGGGGGAMGHMAAGLTLTPELQSRIDALPPATDEPDVDYELATSATGALGVRALIKPFRWPLFVGLLLVAADTVPTLVGAPLIGAGADSASNQDLRGLWIATGVLLAVVLADWWVMWAQTRWVNRTGERLLYSMRLRVFAHLQRLSLDFYDREMAGRIMTRMTSDIDALASLLQDGLINLAINLFTLFGVAVILFVMNWRLALAVMCILPPLVVATLWFRRASERAYARVREKIAAVLAHLQESISGIRVSQAFTQEDRNRSEFREIAVEHLDARLEGNRISAIFFPLVEFLGVIGMAIVIAVGGRLYSQGTLSPGELLAFVLLLSAFFAPIQQLSQVFDTYQQAKAAMDKLSELLTTEPSTPEAPDASELSVSDGRISFDDVRFSYGPGPEALRGVNLEIEPGESVALVGATGAGKSTIMKMIARFYDPASGEISVDGQDLRDVSLDSLRHQLGLVPQDGHLFAGTIRDNIAYAVPDASDAEVEAAARAVGAHDFVASLSDGYLTWVTQDGRSMSAGQRQLVALARAHLADPRILLLDEATSNLDLETEQKVQRAMGVLARGRTTVMIAHRLPTARRADRIAVVDGGRVVEVGTPDDLLRAGGKWTQMWEQWTGETSAPPPARAASS